MKMEYLFRALNDVGDDLIHMAEYRKFPNQWKKWVSLAACLVLIVSLSAVVLPYFPMGCGASMQKEEMAATEAPAAMEEKAEAPAEEAPATKEESVMEEESTAEEPEEEEAAEEATDEKAGALDTLPNSQSVRRFTVCSTIYYLNDRIGLIGEEPKELGDYLGDVTDADDPDLIGCPVYAEAYSAWFSNHAVDGQPVTQNVFVATPDGWLVASTGNEKTVSRYTPEDIQDAIDSGDTQWIINTFVRPVQAQVVDLLEGGKVADSETLNGLFLASLQLNTGVALDWVWIQEDLSILVHPEDVERRLERFLDDFTYDPTETAAYDPQSGMLRFTQEDLLREANGLYLKRASVEGNRVWLWVGLPESDDLYDEKLYELRFDEDSWRYINISTPG